MDKINELIQWIQNIEISQIINIIIAIVVIILTIILSPIISLGISKIFNWKKKLSEIKEGTLYSVIKYFLIVTGVFLGIELIGFNEETKQFIQKLYRIAIIWMAANVIANIFKNKKIFMNKIKTNDPMINFVNKIIKFLLYLVATYLTLKEFDYDIGGMLTGLGLTSAIIALAAQDTVKEIFAGIMIFWDKPFIIGDWVEIGDVAGTVEDITFRSTKIRTTEDTIITVQNSNINSQNVINWGVIKKRIYKTNLKLPLETDEVVVEKIISRIKFILKYNNDIIKEKTRVYFNTIEEDGINIFIYVETPITVYKDYQMFCNKLNLTILNILETQGVKLAYPGQNIYIKECNESSLPSENKKIIHGKKVEKNNS